MVEFDLFAALIAGAFATAVMSMMMSMTARVGMTKMPSMTLISGSMITGEREAAKRLGAVVHYVLMGTIVFGLGYAAVFTAFDDASWWIGAIVGAAHGATVGLLFMPMMPLMHPRMSREPATGGGPTVSVSAGGAVQTSCPGISGAVGMSLDSSCCVRHKEALCACCSCSTLAAR